MRQISKKQSARLREFNAIKKELPPACYICGRKAIDAAHIFPRSLFPEYYTERWNIIPLCRECHNNFDNNLSFRQKQQKIYEIAKEHNEQATYRYFKI